MRGFLEHRIEVTAAGHLNPYWLGMDSGTDTGTTYCYWPGAAKKTDSDADFRLEQHHL
jgi:hypothetical protein